jgi:hypothetical protein
MHGGPLLTPSAKKSSSSPFGGGAESLDPSELAACIPQLRTFLDYILSLPEGQRAAFSGAEWSRLVIVIVLGFRLSLPVASCPQWDDEACRRELDFNAYLDRLCRDERRYPPGNFAHASRDPSMDIVSAFRVVLGVVKEKLEKRVARMRPRPAPAAGIAAGPLLNPMSMGGRTPACPMLDGSLGQYYRMWDEPIGVPINVGMPSGSGVVVDSAATAGAPTAGEPVVSHDIWATMTMEWAQGNMNDISFDGI